ncbi:MAG TPA: hypothetical protein ACHBZ9_00345 [Arsenophonus nasoniae]|uniref:hypothetical protein n=1 Tax=Arsenophonus nasoniae TaxID=638 RepID=UPI0038791619
MEQRNTEVTKKEAQCIPSEVVKQKQPIISVDAILRWVPLAQFCKLTNMNIRTARYLIQNGKLKIKPKPKNKPKSRVYIDWLAYSKEWFM